MIPHRIEYLRKVFFFLMLCISITLHAQEFIYEHFGVDEGLPSSEIYDSYQTKEGYIWFATDKGISRYNGYEFENFDTTDGLTGNVVLRFYPQDNGQIWCYSFHNKSLFYFDEVFKGFKPYKHNNLLAKHLQNGVVKSILLDSQNNLHIGGYFINGELIISDNGVVTSKHATKDFFVSKEPPVKRYLVLKKAANQKNQSFFFTSSSKDAIKQSLRLELDNSTSITSNWHIQNKTAVFKTQRIVKIINHNNTKKDITIKNKYDPIGITIIDDTRFFIGYRFGGGKIMSGTGQVLRAFLHGKSVTNMLIDHEGGYWFTTLASGIYYVKNPSISTYPNLKSNNQHINSLTKTTNKALLIGYKDGTILKLLKDRTTLVINKPKQKGHAFVEYNSMFDETYVYNTEGLTYSFLNQKISSLYFIKLSEPVNNIIFAVSKNKSFKIKGGKIIDTITTPHRVHDATLWKDNVLISTPSGVFKINKDSILPLDTSHALKYRSDDIDVSHNMSHLFAATHGKGVIINDGKQIYNVTEKDGLSSNIVNEIYVENDSIIWACTNTGLNRLNYIKHNKSIISITKNNGLLSNEIEDVEILNDTVWLATKAGLCSFPKTIIKEQPDKNLFLKLKNVTVNGELIPKTNDLVLSHNKNNITLTVEAIVFANKNKHHYKYRLNGSVNTNWEVTKNRDIHFSHLPYGKYNFEVKTCIDDICDPHMIHYTFTITPPFWRTTWFYILGILIVSGLIYLFFKVRVLTYNKDIVRELLRLFLKRLKRKEKYLLIKALGNDIKVKTNTILYIKSSSNYIDIITKTKTHTARINISKFFEHVPDKLEYLRVHRSYIVRVDKVTAKSKNSVYINDIEIPVSQTYIESLKHIHF